MREQKTEKFGTKLLQGMMEDVSPIQLTLEVEPDRTLPKGEEK